MSAEACRFSFGIRGWHDGFSAMGFQVPRAPRGEEGASCNMTPCLPAASLSTWFVALTRERIPEWGNFRLTRLTISLVVLWVLLFSSPSENFLTCGPLCNVYEGRLPRIVTRHGRHGFSQHSNTRTLAQLYQNRSVMYEFTNGIERSRSFQAPGTSCLWYTRFSASRMPGHWYFVPAAPKRSGLFSVPKCSIHAMVPLPLQQCYLSASHEIRESLGVSTDKLMKTSRGGSLTIYSSSTWFLDTIDRKVLAQVSDALALNRMLNQYRIARNKAHPQSLSERVEGTSRNEDLSLDASAVFARPPLEVEPLCGENGPQAFPRLVSNPPKESGEPLSFYFGVDLTAPSLHAGHLLPLLLLRRLWQQEHIRPILLLGTATTRLALHARRCLAAHGEKGRTSFQKGITGSGVSARKCMYPTSAAFNILNNSYWRQYDGEIHENEAFILGQLRRIFAYPTPRTPCHKEVASPRNSSNSQIITDSEVHNSTVGVSERSGSENSALPVPLVVRNSSWLDGLSCGAFLCGAAQALPLSDVYSRMLSRESALVARGVLHRRVRGTNSTSCGNARRTAPQFGVGVSGVSTVGDLGYAVLQAVDFFVLSQLLNCRGQIGGRDQWGNIATGLHVARRLYLQRLCNSPRTSQLSEFEELKHSMRGKEEEVGETSAYEDTSGKTGAKMMEPNKDPFPLIGVTTQLLETSAGKMSKSSGDGTLWLRADWTSPLDFWQHWRSIGDHVALRSVQAVWRECADTMRKCHFGTSLLKFLVARQRTLDV